MERADRDFSGLGMTSPAKAAALAEESTDPAPKCRQSVVDPTCREMKYG